MRGVDTFLPVLEEGRRKNNAAPRISFHKLRVGIGGMDSKVGIVSNGVDVLR